MVYGETGRFPLHVLSYTSCIKYWLRLSTMDTARLPRKAYNMLLSVLNCGQFCWASRMQQVLYKFGFGFVWENRRVQNPEAFIKIFMQRLFNCHSQNWQEHVSNSTRFSIHRMFKTSISIEPYFTSVTNRHIRGHLDKIQNLCIQYSCTQNEVFSTHPSISVVSAL